MLRVDALPRVSDHDIVFTEQDMRPVKQRQKPRQIQIYRKAEWEPMKEDMKSLHKDMKYVHNSETTGINETWENFKDTLQHSINSHIPHRQSRSKDGYPLIGNALKKLMKRQHQYYKIKKKAGNPQHVKRYLDLKHQVQKRQRHAYWNYIGGIVSPQDQQNDYKGMKRFWTYIKHRRSDNVGVSSLKSEGKLYSHPTDKADILNKQFQYVFSSSANLSNGSAVAHW